MFILHPAHTLHILQPARRCHSSCLWAPSPPQQFCCHPHLSELEMKAQKLGSQGSTAVCRHSPSPDPLDLTGLNWDPWPTGSRVRLHTHLPRNKHLIVHNYSTLCRDIFYSIYSSLVHIKDKMIMSHKSDFMSHWSRLPFENAGPCCPAWVDWGLLPINTLGKGNLCHSHPRRQVGPGRKLKPGEFWPHLILLSRSIRTQHQQALHSFSRCMFVTK